MHEAINSKLEYFYPVAGAKGGRGVCITCPAGISSPSCHFFFFLPRIRVGGGGGGGGEPGPLP